MGENMKWENKVKSCFTKSPQEGTASDRRLGERPWLSSFPHVTSSSALLGLLLRTFTPPLIKWKLRVGLLREKKGNRLTFGLKRELLYTDGRVGALGK